LHVVIAISDFGKFTFHQVV